MLLLCGFFGLVLFCVYLCLLSSFPCCKSFENMIDIIFVLHFLNVMLFCSIVFLFCVDLQFAALFRGYGLWLLLIFDLFASVFVRYVCFKWKVIYVHHRFQSCIFLCFNHADFNFILFLRWLSGIYRWLSLCFFSSLTWQCCYSYSVNRVVVALCCVE